MEELAEACDLVVCYLGKDTCEPGLWVDAVKLCRLDQDEGDRHCFTSALGGVVVQLKMTAPKV